MNVLSPTQQAAAVHEQWNRDYEQRQAARRADFFQTTTASPSELGEQLARQVAANAENWGLAMKAVDADPRDQTLLQMLVMTAMAEISKEATE